MKELKLYECEHCHTKYNTKVEAERCESNHKMPKKLKAGRYLSKGQCATGYPVTITVMFDDNREVTYKR